MPIFVTFEAETCADAFCERFALHDDDAGRWWWRVRTYVSNERCFFFADETKVRISSCFEIAFPFCVLLLLVVGPWNKAVRYSSPRLTPPPPLASFPYRRWPGYYFTIYSEPAALHIVCRESLMMSRGRNPKSKIIFLAWRVVSLWCTLFIS